MTIDEAVQIALEQNLDVQVAESIRSCRSSTVDITRGVWLPQLSGNMQFRNSVHGAQQLASPAPIETLTSRSFCGTASSSRCCRRARRSQRRLGRHPQHPNNTFSNFNPSSGLEFSFDSSQPLWRGLQDRRQPGAVPDFQKKNQEITDIQLQQQIIATTRAVRLAYWTLVGARYNLGVAQASLDISRQTLRDNRTRVEVGTMAPIDVVGAEAEVARNEESAIVAAAQIDEAEDSLRALIFDPKAPEFWTMDLELADAPQLPATQADVDVEAAVKNALEKRTDLIAAPQAARERRRSTSSLDKDQHEAADQRRGQLRAERATAASLVTERGPRRSEQSRSSPARSSATDVAGLRQRARRSWSASISRPGRSASRSATRSATAPRRCNRPAEAGLHQQELSLRSSRAGRRDARYGAWRGTSTPTASAWNRRRRPGCFSERQLDAARKKFAVGLAQSIDVLIAQRDLAQGPVQRAERDHRLRQVARRARDGAGRRLRRRPGQHAGRERRRHRTAAGRKPGRPYNGACPRRACSVTVITKNEAARTRRRAGLGRLGRRDRRRRRRQHRRHRRHRPRRTPIASSSRAGRLRRSRRTTPPSLASARLDPVARRRRAGDAGAGRRRSGRCSPRARRTPATACRASPGTSAAGCAPPTGIPTTSCGSTTAAPARWTGRYVHESVRVDGTVGRLRGELQHYAYRDIADHLETHRSLHDAAPRARCGERGRARRRCCELAGASAARLPAQLHRSAAASATAIPGFIISAMNS